MDATQVLALLRDNRLFDETDEGVLLRACVRALGEVREKLRDGVDEGDLRIASAAAALARFRLFCAMLERGERFSGFKAGDMTVSRDLKGEFAAERALRDEALVDAAPILRDGGFFFAAQ
jgi:hypothetical protein